MTSPQTDRFFGLGGNVAIKAPVACVAASNITLSGEQTIDGITTSTSDVLVTGQTDETTNGIYTTNTGLWTRRPDFDGVNDIVQGTLVNVYGGTLYAASLWQVTTANTIVIGTSNITIVKISVLSGSSTYVSPTFTGTATIAAANFSGAVGFNGNTTFASSKTAEFLGSVEAYDGVYFQLYNTSDATKVGNFNLGNITTGNTRQLSFPDASGTIALHGTDETFASVTANSTSDTNLFTASLNSTTGANAFTVNLSNASSGTSAGPLIGFKLNGATYSGTVDLSSGLTGLYIGGSTFTTSGGAGGNITGIDLHHPTINGSGTDYFNILGLLINVPSGSNGANLGSINGISIQNQGLSGVGNSYGINIAHQSGSTNSYAISCVDGFSVNGNKNVTIGTAALATSATAGFLWIPSCAGAPTGNATAPYSNAVALVYDTADNKLYVSPNGGGTWKSVTFS